MRHFNKNSILFAFSAVFIIVGLIGSSFSSIFNDCIHAVSEMEQEGVKASIIKLTENLSRDTNERLLYYHNLLDVNSLKENLFGTRLIEKKYSKVIKTDMDSLVSYKDNKLSERQLNDRIQTLRQLYSISEFNNSNFLYVAIPEKESFESFPCNFLNNKKYDYDCFYNKLISSKLPFIDLGDFLSSNGSLEKLYFYTDNHWKPHTGFVAGKAICEQLKQRYGFQYNADYTDINNYTIRTYKECFLGSYGKNVGTYFTWRGLDDFDLILPKFETDITEDLPFKLSSRRGRFEDVLIYYDNLNTKDIYETETYATYCGGNYRLEIIKNHKPNNGAKVLIIKDSFANVVTPFLCLQTSELHICDMRGFERMNGQEIDLKQYINGIKPGYVLVLFGGVSSLESLSTQN